jgi:hypothetical protein
MMGGSTTILSLALVIMIRSRHLVTCTLAALPVLGEAPALVALPHAAAAPEDSRDRFARPLRVARLRNLLKGQVAGACLAALAGIWDDFAVQGFERLDRD